MQPPLGADKNDSGLLALKAEPEEKARNRSVLKVSCMVCALSSVRVKNVFTNDTLGNHNRKSSGEVMMADPHKDEHNWHFAVMKPHCLTVELRLTRLEDAQNPNGHVSDALKSLQSTSTQHKPLAFLKLAYAVMDAAVIALTTTDDTSMKKLQHYFGAHKKSGVPVPAGALWNKNDSRYSPGRYCDSVAGLDLSTLTLLMRLHVPKIEIAQILEKVIFFLVNIGKL